MGDFDLVRAKSYFTFEKGLTYLNHASHGPLSIPARDAYNKFFDSWQKTAHRHDPDSFRMFEELRGRLAAFVNSAPQNIGFIPHTSYGLNLASSGYPFVSGDNIVLCDKSFPAIIYPWLRLKNKGIEIRFAPARNGYIDEQAIMAATDGKTRLIAITWVQFNNGYRADLEKLGEFCHKNDIFFCVDGIQGLGAVPLDLGNSYVDLFSCGCQKWMLGPCGTGFVYLSDKAQTILDPPLMGWLGVDWGAEFDDLMRYELPLRNSPGRFEFGTSAFQDLYALNESVKIITSFGAAHIWNQVSALTQQLIGYVKSSKKFTLITSDESRRRSGIVSFKAENSSALFAYLSDRGFVVSLRENAIRVSPHFYNSPDDIVSLIKALEIFNG